MKKFALAGLAGLFLLPLLPAAEKLSPPPSGPIRVAVVLSEGATVIDFAGPWEVFQDVQLPGADAPFTLYTVSDSTQPIHTSAGMTVVPHYSFKDAPPPHVVVIGAQRGHSPEMLAWLRTQAA